MVLIRRLRQRRAVENQTPRVEAVSPAERPDWRLEKFSLFGLSLATVCVMNASGTVGDKVKSDSKLSRCRVNFTRGPQRSFFRLMAGWTTLLLYLAACSPAGLGLAALAGSLDVNHQLILAAGERDGRVVLHHGIQCGTHRHGPAARVLTLFAQPAKSGDPDHVLQISTADTLKSQGGITAPQPHSDGNFSDFALATPLSISPASFDSRFSAITSPRESSALRCLRSTVLLI